MPIARSKVTAQVGRRPGKFTFKDIHRRIFGTRTPKRRSFREMKEGIAEYVRERYARTGGRQLGAGQGLREGVQKL